MAEEDQQAHTIKHQYEKGTDTEITLIYDKKDYGLVKPKSTVNIYGLDIVLDKDENGIVALMLGYRARIFIIMSPDFSGTEMKELFARFCGPKQPKLVTDDRGLELLQSKIETGFVKPQFTCLELDDDCDDEVTHVMKHKDSSKEYVVLPAPEFTDEEVEQVVEQYPAFTAQNLWFACQIQGFNNAKQENYTSAERQRKMEARNLLKASIQREKKRDEPKAPRKEESKPRQKAEEQPQKPKAEEMKPHKKAEEPRPQEQRAPKKEETPRDAKDARDARQAKSYAKISDELYMQMLIGNDVESGLFIDELANKIDKAGVFKLMEKLGVAQMMPVIINNRPQFLLIIEHYIDLNILREEKIQFRLIKQERK